MAGVNPPNNERLLQLLGDLDSRLRAVETQQQQTITDSQGRPVINFGLIPGSNPARYGMQFVDPNSGAEELFIGESTGATYGVMLTVGSDGVIESANFVPGSAGFQLLPNGDASFNQLTLANGIIGDAALTKPVNIGNCNAVAASFTYSGGTFSTRISTNIAVPSGFSSALVLGIATAGTTWAAGGGDLSCLCVINGNNGDTIGCGSLDADALSISAPFSIALSGLGANISVACSAAGTNGASGTGNARVSAIAMFLR